jgi:hypothetical protein
MEWKTRWFVVQVVSNFDVLHFLSPSFEVMSVKDTKEEAMVWIESQRKPNLYAFFEATTIDQ